jgi:hypothetical protein
MIDVFEISKIPDFRGGVFNFIRNFNGLPRFVPLVTPGRMVGQGIGSRRHIQVVQTEGETVETLEALDDTARRLSFSVQVPSLRMHDYCATIEVEDLTPDRCRVSWNCQFCPVDGDDEAKTVTFIKASYTGAMSCLADAVRT